MKYKIGDEVWIAGTGEAQLGTVDGIAVSKLTGKTEYEVLINQDPRDSGSETFSGWSEHRCHETKLGALHEIHTIYAELHFKLGVQLGEGVFKYWEKPRKLEKVFKNINNILHRR